MIVVLLAFVYGGCGSSTLNTGITSSPTSLHVVRTVGDPELHVSPLDRTITDVQAVQQLYQAALKLSKASSTASYSCPNDLSVHYLLSFQQNTMTQKMDLNATGCMFLQISSTDLRWTTPSFQSLVAQVIGISSFF